ncbi:hypothetical protein LJR118_001611 [Acidovorax sp. LjRoot118]|uniref:hypothetical protein n=1 Tax=Acidovorax sp. LjRoot118 TaxID=3342256 RepID=UPI003ECFBA75
MKRLTTAAIATLGLMGCSGNALNFNETPQGGQSVANLDEAGSVHVSVLAVIPWEDVKSKLKPNLTIDAKTLRDQAIPVTYALLDKYLDILRFQAALAPNTVKTTSTLTSTSETGVDDNTANTQTITKAPGTPRDMASTASLPAGSGPTANAATVSAINSSLTARAMASFVQEVQALNAEVDGAAMRTGYDPYLMRIQLSVMPRRRHLGYDVYPNLSFFGYSGSFDKDTGAPSARTATEGTPFVVPLLSSDSIETAQRSQSIEALRDVGVALDLVKGFGAAGFSFSSQKDRQQALQGLDVNSVLTLGRLSDNTIRVRLGAAYDPGGGHSVHPRTNTISLLVFFPKKADLSRVVARTEWNHVEGSAALRRGGDPYEERLKRIQEQWPSLGLTLHHLKEIDELPFGGDYKSYENAMNGFLAARCKDVDPKSDKQVLEDCPVYGRTRTHVLNLPGRAIEKERTYAYFWAHLLAVLPGSRYSTTIVDLPKLRPMCPPPSQLVAYLEDDKGISIALRGGKDLSSRLKAVMHWSYLTTAAPPVAPVSAKRAKGAPSAVAVVPPPQRSYAGGLMASAIAITDERKVAELQFASDRMEAPTGMPRTVMSPLAIELGECNFDAAPPIPGNDGIVRLLDAKSQFYLLGARIPKKEKDVAKDKVSEVALTATSTNLLVSKGSAATTVTIDLGEKPKSAFALTVVGATVKAATPADMVSRRGDGAYLVKASGPVDLTFNNLLINQTLDLELRPVDEKDKLGAAAKKLTFTVRNNKG